MVKKSEIGKIKELATQIRNQSGSTWIRARAQEILEIIKEMRK